MRSVAAKQDAMISVIICTRNRAESLKRMLQSLAKLSCPIDLDMEIVVVDNNSTDATRMIVEDFRQKSGLGVQYVFEAELGLSHARNAGIQGSRGDIIAFTDDDMVLSADWITAITKECSKHSDTAMFFGRTAPMRSDVPKLAVKELDSDAVYVFPCDPGDPGPGNNMVLRRSVVKTVGEFDTTLGAGSSLKAAEDTDYTYRVLRAGNIVRYCPAILAYHDHDRLSLQKVRQLQVNYGKGKGGFYCKHILRRDAWAAKSCYWEIRAFAKELFKTGSSGRAGAHLYGLVVGAIVRISIEIQELGTRILGRSPKVVGAQL